MYRHIFTSSLQRRKCPYNFIYAVRKKLKCQLIIKPKPSKFPNYWKTPNLENALNALRARLAQFFMQCEGNSTEELHGSSSTQTSSTQYYNELFVHNEYNSKSLVDLLRIRKQMLVDRTVTLFSWLEVQVEKLKSANLFKNIQEIRKLQENLLENMQKERLYIDRLLLLYAQKTESFLNKTVSKLKESKENPSFQEKSLLTYDLRSEVKLKCSNKSKNWQHNALDYVLRRHILDQPVGSEGYYNLYLWILKKRVQKGSALLALFPQYNNNFKMIWQDDIETEDYRLKKEESNSQEISKSAKNLCKEYDLVPLKQNTETSANNEESQNSTELALKDCIIMPNKLSQQEISNIERINKDVTLELLEEHGKTLGKYDTSKLLNSLKHKNVFNDPANFLANCSESFLKLAPRNNVDHIEKVLIYELYNEDVQWDNKYAITGDVLKVLIDTLIKQHFQDIVKFIIP